nr:DNA-directed RNA polymerase III subunit 1-like [Tanacetum cinerariifolium]
MSQCGSKGSPININMMIACVGQQSVGGQRALNGFMDRSLPYFPRRSKTPAAKGFVANSFYSGLTATKFFFHTMGGREGLVDTTVKTADTSFMFQKLMKGLEDLLVYYDKTVRDSNACIVQFTYGGDGRDPFEMEGKARFPLNFDRFCGLLMEKVTLMREVLLSSEMHLYVGSMDVTLRVPRIREILNATKKISTPVITAKLRYNDNLSYAKLVKVQMERTYLGQIDTGTNIGAIDVTLGVPRIMEILNATKKISTPVITAKLRSNDNLSYAKLVKVQMERTYLGQVKTADTSFMFRKLMKGLEDLLVYYDNTVRDSNACFVQFTYGGDGRDPFEMEGKARFPLNFDRLLMKAKV